VKVALIHDWITGTGPEEACLETLCQIFPDAVVYTLFIKSDRLSPTLTGMDIRSSGLEKWPGMPVLYRWYWPFFPAFIEHIDLRGYDLVISNTRYFAGGVLTQPETCHVCILHPTIMTLWYSPEQSQDDVLPGYPGLGFYLRLWSMVASHRVDYFLSGSEAVAGHIRKYYRRETQGCIDFSMPPQVSGTPLRSILETLFSTYRAQTPVS